MFDRLSPASVLAPLVALASPATAQLGTAPCSSAPSSTGAPVRLTAHGSLDPAQNDLRLRLEGLPAHPFGVLLVAHARARLPLAPWSSGTLCLAPPMGALPVLAQMAGGALELPLDLAAVPGPGGTAAVVRGDSLQFQYWFRDLGPGGASSNLSNSLSLTFAPGPWFGGRLFALEGVPSEHALGDVDGDGALDEVVLNRATGEVTIARGLGDGTFGPGRRHPMAPTPSMLRLADVDGDGDLDLLHASAAAPGLPRSPALLLNQGGGVFGAPALLPFPPDLARFEVGDLDGDGDADVVALSEPGGPHHVLWNDGAGGFALGPQVDAGAGSQGAALGDLDGDARPDLVNAHGSVVRLLPGAGAAGFGPPMDLLTAPLAGEPLLADVDGDGALDLVALDRSGTHALVLRLGRGDGTFDAPRRVLLDAPPLRLDAADLDGLAGAEVLVSRPADALVLRAGGAVGLVEAARLPLAAARHALGDLDDDGRVDLTSLVATTLEVHLNGGALEFGFGTALDAPPTPLVHLRAGDLDGDGRLELIYPSAAPGGGYAVVWAGGLGGGSLGAVVAAGQPVRECWVGDLDGDGLADLAGHDWTSARLVPHLNRGGGSFLALPSVAVVPNAWIEAADLDGDGDMDLVLPSATTAELSIVRNLGGGSFAAEARAGTGVPSHEVALADVDGDGVADLVTLNSGHDLFSVFRGDGAGAFRAPTALPAHPDAWYFALGDLDGDGDTDLVEAAGTAVRLHRNRGDGTFEPAASLPTGGVVYSLLLVDVDQDGDLDLVTLHSTERAFALLLNAGDGRTFEEQRHGLMGTPYWLGRVAPDLDGDGDPDLVAYVGAGRLLALFNALR